MPFQIDFDTYGVLFIAMIRSFKDKHTEAVFDRRPTRKWAFIARQALRKLDMIHAAAKLTDLSHPAGNKLEALLGNRNGQHSIRINRQYRVCFVWNEDGAYDVEITDYH